MRLSGVEVGSMVPADEGGGGGPKPSKRRRWDTDGPAYEDPELGEGAANGEAKAPKLALPGGLAATLQKAKEALKVQKQIAEKLKGLKQKGISIPGTSAASKSGGAKSRGPKPLRLERPVSPDLVRWRVSCTLLPSLSLLPIWPSFCRR